MCVYTCVCTYKGSYESTSFGARSIIDERSKLESSVERNPVETRHIACQAPSNSTLSIRLCA